MLFLFVDWYEIKKEMAHFLDSKAIESKAVTLTLDKEEFARVQWIEKDREFLYEGKLYDVVVVPPLSPSSDTGNTMSELTEREASLFTKP
jgi:hypothetical protein